MFSLQLPNPEDVAWELRHRSGQRDSLTDLNRIIELWPELKLTFDAIDGDGYLLDLGKLGGEIIVNATKRTTRRRYTVAHELGHWYLNTIGISVDPDKHDIVEIWCNAFAACLLIPNESIIELTDWNNVSIQKLIDKAHSLEVSFRALVRRVLETSSYSGGALRFCWMGKPNALNEIKLRLDWGEFPKAAKLFIPR